jgi:adenylate cyclase class 2
MHTFEVENKFRVRDLAELKRRLRQQFGSSKFSKPASEADTFFQHPCRDFVQTDESLRLRKRTFADGTSEHVLTYKGPKIDSKTKTRQEIEMSITEPERWESFFIALGFRKSASIQKYRRRLDVIVENREVEITLDTLPALPESAQLFLEVETLSTPDEVEECRALILGLAKQLGLGKPVRKSYLHLVHGR